MDDLLEITILQVSTAANPQLAGLSGSLCCFEMAVCHFNNYVIKNIT